MPKKRKCPRCGKAFIKLKIHQIHCMEKNNEKEEPVQTSTPPQKEAQTQPREEHETKENTNRELTSQPRTVRTVHLRRHVLCVTRDAGMLTPAWCVASPHMLYVVIRGRRWGWVWQEKNAHELQRKAS